MLKNCSLIILACCFASLSAMAQTIQAVTETSSLSYMQDGKVVGEATMVVEEVLGRAKLDYTIKIYPWARSYKLALENKNVLIFPMSRTAERESLFKWVGELIPIKYYLIKLKERKDIQINSLEDAKQYRIGVVREDVRAKFLIEKGFEVKVHGLQLVTSNDQNIQKLLKKRIDLFPMSGIGFLPLCEKNNIDCSLLEKAYLLEELSTGLWLAYNLETSDDLVEKTAIQLNAIKQDGTYDKIIGKRLFIN